MKKRNYKTMHEGTNQLLAEGNTEFPAHVASDEHQKETQSFQHMLQAMNTRRKHRVFTAHVASDERQKETQSFQHMLQAMNTRRKHRVFSTCCKR